MALAPRVSVDEEIAWRARQSLSRMLGVSKQMNGQIREVGR